MTNAQPPVALITGSGRHRVGNVIARQLAQDGYRIALHYHSSAEAAEETLSELRSRGAECEAFKADVACEAQVHEMADNVVNTFGQIDVLVTTASIWNARPLEDITADDVRKSFDVNTLGTFLVARDVGLRMTQQPTGGSIVTIGDSAINRPYINYAGYFIAKGSLPTLTQTLAIELGHRNPKVRVNCIHPGPVMFPPGISDADKQALRDSTLVKEADCPEAVAHAVKFLTDNKFITGACLPIDGGRHIYTPESATRLPS